MGLCPVVELKAGYRQWRGTLHVPEREWGLNGTGSLWVELWLLMPLCEPWTPCSPASVEHFLLWPGEPQSSSSQAPER